MAPAARGSLSHRVGRGDRRCPAAPPALGDRGDHQDPAGRQRRGVRAGGEPAQREVTHPPPQKKYLYRRAILARFAFLAGGASGALEPGVTCTAWGTGIATSTLGTVFASGAGGARGAWVTLQGEKVALARTEGALPPSRPRPGPARGLRGGSCAATPSEKPLFTVSPGGCSAQGPLHRPAPARSKQRLPEPPNLGGGRNPSSPPVNPSRSQLPLDSHVRAGWSHAAGSAGESGGSLGKERREVAQAPHQDHPPQLPPHPTAHPPPYSQGGPEHPGLLWDQ